MWGRGKYKQRPRFPGNYCKANSVSIAMFTIWELLGNLQYTKWKSKMRNWIVKGNGQYIWGQVSHWFLYCIPFKKKNPSWKPHLNLLFNIYTGSSLVAQWIKYPVFSGSGCCLGAGSVPDLGTSTCGGHGQKKKYQEQKSIPLPRSLICCESIWER